MKRVIAMMLVLTMVLSLAACGGKQASADETKKVPADSAAEDTADGTEDSEEHEPVTLRFSWWGGDERRDATLAVIEQFEDLYPYITIEAEYGSSDGYHDKLATALSAGTSADIVQVDPEVFPQFVNGHDYFYDYKEFDFDLSNFDEAYISAEINGRYDGKQLGLPTGISGAAVLVNVPLCEEIGITDFMEPYTYDELIEAGKKVHEYDEELYLLCTNTTYLVNMVVFPYCKLLLGKPLVDTDAMTMNVTEEMLCEALQTVKDLYDNNVIAPASYMASYDGDNMQNDANWINGKYVMAITYSSTADVMTAASPEIEWKCGYTPTPVNAVVGGAGGNTPQVIAVAKTCEHPEEAMMFMDYFFNNETAMSTLQATRSVPSTARAREICVENGWVSEVVAVACDHGAEYENIPNDGVSSTPECKALISDAVEQVAYGVATPEEAAAELYSAILELLN